MNLKILAAIIRMPFLSTYFNRFKLNDWGQQKLYSN